jgi:hypothetical protein
LNLLMTALMLRIKASVAHIAVHPANIKDTKILPSLLSIMTRDLYSRRYTSNPKTREKISIVLRLLKDDLYGLLTIN